MELSKDEIIRMAREVWGERAVLPFNDLERFAALVAAHERENSAKMQGDCTLAAVLAERDKALEAARTVGGEFFVEFEKVYLK